EQVTLDPQMAGPYLILSQDHKMLRFSRIRNHGDSPKRFLSCPSILGSQGFTSGRHYWEVKVGKGGYCALGVALESVPSEDQLRSGKVWALRQKLCGRYTAVPTPPYPLAVREELQRIRVHLDYEAGRVTFYNAKDMTQILQFQATFTEKVFPYFWIRSVDNHIHLC
ncbi:TRI39 ligase, partial [Urocynchramus pylzowi]|nr:TRI39 ligase [Urocynchramus pylzowi]